MDISVNQENAMTNNENSVYRKLQIHIDNQSIGFPAVKSGADIRLLKHHFTEEEASLALNLTFRYEPFDEILSRLQDKIVDGQVVRKILEQLVAKRCLLYREKNGIPYYCLRPFLIGFEEANLDNLSLNYLNDLNEYVQNFKFGTSYIATKIPQMRTIPIEKSIPIEFVIANYDDAKSLIINSTSPIYVVDCHCRIEKHLQGQICKQTERLNTCMILNDRALYYEKFTQGEGRLVEKEEAIEIMRRNQEEGLVLQTMNSQKVDYLCACCGCCCGTLLTHKKLPNPLAFWATNFYALSNKKECIGCGNCITKCQVDAIKYSNNKESIKIDLKRCIGCGNCVVACKQKAIKLVKKNKEIVPPRDYDEMHEIIYRYKGKWDKLRVVRKFTLGF